MTSDTTRMSLLKSAPPMDFASDHARRLDAEEGSRALLERIHKLLERRERELRA